MENEILEALLTRLEKINIDSHSSTVNGYAEVLKMLRFELSILEGEGGTRFRVSVRYPKVDPIKRYVDIRGRYSGQATDTTWIYNPADILRARVLFPRLWDYGFVTGISFLYEGGNSTKFKVVTGDRNKLLSLPDNFEEDDLVEKDYSSVIGDDVFEFDRADKPELWDKYRGLTENQFYSHPLWNVLFDEDLEAMRAVWESYSNYHYKTFGDKVSSDERFRIGLRNKGEESCWSFADISTYNVCSSELGEIHHSLLQQSNGKYLFQLPNKD